MANRGVVKVVAVIANSPPIDALRIAHLYPELLGTYGDGGNAHVLAARARWRGVAVDSRDISPGESVPVDADIYVLGGGENVAQVTAAQLLREDGGLHRAVDRGAVVLAVCAGMQILGAFYEINGTRHRGLGLLDCESHVLPQRAVGEVRATSLVPLPGSPDAGIAEVLGFENHRGGTTLGAAAQPLARIVAGVGNDGGGHEGAVQGRIVATYLHGPVLALNPLLADHLLTWVLGPLPPVDEELARRSRALRRPRLRIDRS